MQLPLYTRQDPISATIGKSAHGTRPDDIIAPPKCYILPGSEFQCLSNGAVYMIV